MLTAMTPALLTAGSVVYSLRQLHQFRIRSMDLTLPALPPGLDDLPQGIVPQGNSLAAYSTSRTVLRGGGGGDVAPLPDIGVGSMHSTVVVLGKKN
jgi:hypothetical protein